MLHIVVIRDHLDFSFKHSRQVFETLFFWGGGKLLIDLKVCELGLLKNVGFMNLD